MSDGFPLPTSFAEVRFARAPGSERLLMAFTEWVATNRAYNGSEHRHGQALYNECLNAVLSEWATEFLAESAESS